MTLRYQLDLGRTYTWRLVVDRFVVGDRSIRFSASFHIDALDADRLGNTQVRMRARSAMPSQEAEVLIDSLKAGLFPVGNRRSNKAGVYDAVLDEFGTIITGRYAPDEQAPVPTITSLGVTTKVEAPQYADIPSLLGTVMPAMPSGDYMPNRGSRRDTLYVPATTQRIANSRGAGSSQAKAKPVFDTVYRHFTVDSVDSSVEDNAAWFITVTSERFAHNGSHTRTVTTIVRDRATGLPTQIIEKVANVDADGTVLPSHLAVAILETDITPKRDSFGNEIDVTPSMMPGGLR